MDLSPIPILESVVNQSWGSCDYDITFQTFSFDPELKRSEMKYLFTG